MEKIAFQTTRQIHKWIIDNVGPEDLVLTAGGRMARQILDLFREKRLAHEDISWIPIRVMSLNEWLRRTWIEIWPEYIPASELRRILIWSKAIQQKPPPGISFEGLLAAKDLDKNYATLIRHMIDPGKRDVSQPLARWSFEVSRIFVEIMGNERLIHPAEIPAYLSGILSVSNMSEIKSQDIVLSKRIILAGMDQAEPVEMKLFSCLDEITQIVWLEIQDSQADQYRPNLSAFSFPDMVQEVEWIVEKALEFSVNFPLHRIGIAVTDIKTYNKLFERVLSEIMGERAGEGWSSFNITMGRPVIKSSLVQAGMLPIRISLDGQSRTNILALLQSPYYSIWGPQRHRLAMQDISWRKNNINSGFEDLMDSIKDKHPREAEALNDIIAALSPFLPMEHKRNVREWNKNIFEIWHKLGFPVIANEEDSVAREHLIEGILEMDKELSEESMDLNEYFEWLSLFLTNKIFSSRGYENAGIQIMGLIEARGLSFDHLFIAGMISGALPQPARLLPFLSLEEKKQIQGGTTEDQYRFASILFSKLLAVSPNLILSRPEQSKGEPFIPSPFFPDEKKSEADIDLWYTENPIWARSKWLAQTRRATENIDKPISNDILGDTSKGPLPVPTSISVTALEDGIACPFRFFVLHCLGLFPLNETKSGILPRIRGEIIHRCLAAFVDEVIIKKLDLIDDSIEVEELLKEKASELISPLSGSLHWRVEFRRWLDEPLSLPPNNPCSICLTHEDIYKDIKGNLLNNKGSAEGFPDENKSKGLFYSWLEQEKQNWAKGIRWLATELSFSDLVIGEYKMRISGRIDRVDQHQENSYICWDYKTGKIPTRKDVQELRTSQILPYLLALQKGVTRIKIPSGVPVSGGFIRLDSAGKVKIFEVSIEDDGGKGILEQWEKRVIELFNRLIRADVRPLPLPAPTRKDDGACKGCPVLFLCSYKILNKKY